MEDSLPFHQKHLPNFTKWGKAIVWKWMHLYFPIMIHYLTDKYKDRWHHFVIDSVYAVITFVFVGANIGLGIWYWRYFTPANINLQVITTSNVVSGKKMDLSVVYVNTDRDLQDVTIDVLLPDGFVSAPNGEKQAVHYELGTLPHDQNGTLNISGIVFGDVGATYDARVIVGYTSYSHRQYTSAVKRFSVIGTSFAVDVHFPDSVTYNAATPWNIHYKNNGNFDLNDVAFDLHVPSDFTVNTVSIDGASYSYQKGEPVAVGTVAAGAEGTVELTGTFAQPANATVLGDQQVPISVDTHASVFNQELQVHVPVAQGTSVTAVQLIAPRVVASVTGDASVAFGDLIHATVTVRNTGDHAVDNIVLQATTTSPATVTNAHVNGFTASVSGGTLTFPAVEHLDSGAEASFTLTVPTRVSSEQGVSSQLRIFGTGFSPEAQATIPVQEVTLDTRYESQISLSAQPLYTGPNGEQIGYGPYPPVVGQVTALRVLLRLQNLNNALSSVHVHTTLPSQVEWTGSQSVSEGTTLVWDSATRSIDWTIGSLNPQSQVYGAQFEVRITPNIYQVGLTPHLANDFTITAFDTFTGTTVSTNAAAVATPAVQAE